MSQGEVSILFIALVLTLCVVAWGFLQWYQGRKDWQGYVGGKLYPFLPFNKRRDKGSEPEEQQNAPKEFNTGAPFDYRDGRRDYTCSICNKMGHNKRTCPANTPPEDD